MDLYPDLKEAVPVRIPTGCMVAFRGDYVHGGSFYDRNHTRIFMGLTMSEDMDINTTHLEDTKKTPPPEIKKDGANAGEAGGSRHGKDGRKNKKKKQKA